jgi:hypothetical protein
MGGDGLPGEALFGDYIRGEEAVFRVDLPEGHYQGAVFLTDKSAEPVDHGPMEVIVLERFGERPILDSTVIRSGQAVAKRFNINMTGERYITFRLKFKAAPGAHFIVNALTFTRVEPHIAHVPVRRAEPGKRLDISASVTLPPAPNDEHALTSLGIITSNASTLAVPDKIVRVTLKTAADSDDFFSSRDMRVSDEDVYTATIPAGNVKTGKLCYFLEAEDSTGRVVRLPDAGAAFRSFEIDVTDDCSAPTMIHKPGGGHAPGEPLEIRVKAADDSSVDKVLLHFRPTRQTMEYTVLDMKREGDDYIATIPGSTITRDFDLMYYFEVFDIHENACLYPDPENAQPYFVTKINR